MALSEEQLDKLRDLVAHFIINSAEDADCLYEVVGDLTSEYLDWDDPEFQDLDREIVKEAYVIFDRARVYVTIDEVEYSA